MTKTKGTDSSVTNNKQLVRLFNCTCLGESDAFEILASFEKSPDRDRLSFSSKRLLFSAEKDVAFFTQRKMTME